MSNLENVYAYLMEKYTHNYYVSYISPVSYINAITGCNEKIVFMCEKVCKKYYNIYKKRNLFSI